MVRHGGSERYRLGLEAMPDGALPAIRLRADPQAQSWASRLRCRTAEDMTPRSLPQAPWHRGEGSA